MKHAVLYVKRYRKGIIPLIIFVLLMVAASNTIGASWETLVQGIGKGLVFITYMFPPDWSAFGEMLNPAIQSITLAFLGTAFGLVFSLFFGFAAASNITPAWLRNTSRFLISTERALPEIVILLLLIAALGLGAFAGIMALSFGCIGMLGKIFADAIEEIDSRTLESIEAVGAGKLQVIFFGVLPQIIPAIISNGIFRFEINIRLSVVLGAIGAGGIGYELYHSFAMLEYQRALTALLVILTLIFAAERISDVLRRKLEKATLLK